MGIDGGTARPRSTMRLDHPVVATEKPQGPSLDPYPGIARKAQGHRGTLWTCETYCRIRQDNQDRSMDHVGTPRYVSITVGVKSGGSRVGGPELCV